MLWHLESEVGKRMTWGLQIPHVTFSHTIFDNEFSLHILFFFKLSNKELCQILQSFLQNKKETKVAISQVCLLNTN